MIVFFGHTRFSLYSPSSGGWRASNGSRFRSAQEYRSYLFSDERMAPRMKIFLDFSLPQIELASQGYEVHHVVSYPSTLPGKYRRQLHEAAERFPFLILDEHGPGGPPVDRRQLAAKHHLESGAPFARYRLDDDDLLPADYFEQVAPYVRRENAGMMVSLGSGGMALYADGRYFNLRRCHVPMIAIGLLGICRFEADGTLIEPVAASHNQSDRANPVILDSRRPGFLWTRHVAQDSSLGFGAPDDAGLVDVLLGYMDKHPAATPDDGIEAAFPSVGAAFSGLRHPGSQASPELTPDKQVLDQATELAITPLRGTFSLTLDVQSEKGIGKNNLLLSFSVADEQGRVLDPATERDWLPGSGLMVSNNPAIGYFCYVPVRRGMHRSQHHVELPEGLRITRVTAQRFASSTVDILLRRVLVEAQG